VRRKRQPRRPTDFANGTPPNTGEADAGHSGKRERCIMARSLDDIIATRDKATGRFGPKAGEGEGEGQGDATVQPEANADGQGQTEPNAAATDDTGKTPDKPGDVKLDVTARKPDGQQAPPSKTGEGDNPADKPNANANPAGNKPPAPSNDNEPDPEKNWTYAAYKDKSEQARKWRERAQNAERQLAELQAKQAKPEAPDIFADPDGYRQHFEGSVDDRFKRHEANISFRLARREHGTVFEEAYTAMLELAENGDPSVVRGVYASSDPGEALVTWFKRSQAIQEIGDDPAAYKQRLRDELKAEILAELQAGGGTQPNGQQQQQPNGNNALPPNMPSKLAGVRSVAPRQGPAWGGPAPIADIFDRARQARNVR
jgi:hypothetical protein